MPHQVVWEKVSVGVAPGETEETVVHRGGLLPEWVDEFTYSTAVSVGAAKFVPDDALDAALFRQAVVPPPVRLPEHPADLPRTNLAAADLISVAGLEDEAQQLVEEYDADNEVVGVRDESSDGKPDGRSGVAQWREFHVRQQVAQGRDEQEARDEAEGMDKPALVAQYK